MSTPPPSTPSNFLTAWLCAVASLGCAGAQVKPPEPEPCPKEALEAMSQVLKIDRGVLLRAVMDINQPYDFRSGQRNEGVYQDGPIIGRITEDDGSNLPEGTLLHGRLWTGPGIYDQDPNTWEVSLDQPAAMGRYHLAILPDGRKYPVCIVTGDIDGRLPKKEGSKPGATLLNREVPVSAVTRWP